MSAATEIGRLIARADCGDVRPLLAAYAQAQRAERTHLPTLAEVRDRRSGVTR